MNKYHKWRRDLDYFIIFLCFSGAFIEFNYSFNSFYYPTNGKTLKAVELTVFNKPFIKESPVRMVFWGSDRGL